MTQGTQLANVHYLSTQWFISDPPEVTLTTTADPNSIVYGMNSAQWDSSSNIYYTPTYWWPYTVEAKIRLTLTEVEHLRKLCRSDKRLRATMEKIAPHIEVEVDFPG